MIEINNLKVGSETEETIKTAIKLYKMELERNLIHAKDIFCNKNAYYIGTVNIISDEIRHVEEKLKIIDSVIDLFKD